MLTYETIHLTEVSMWLNVHTKGRVTNQVGNPIALVELSRIVTNIKAVN